MSGLGGPISVTLEADLRDEVRRKGIVLWLDLHEEYSGFVDRLQAAETPYEVHAFRGSYLKLMLELESLTGGLERPQLLIHLPGHNEERIKRSPLLELYAAGTRYRRRLNTLVSEAAGGRARREQIDAFQEEGDLTLDKADAWLSALLDERGGGLRAQLRAMSLNAVIDDLLAGGLLAGRLVNSDDKAALWEQLDAWTGLHQAWRDTQLPSAALARPDDVAFAASSWALCVEYVDDLRRAPISPLLKPAVGLPSGVVAACKALAEHLRARHRPFYERSADETEPLLADEVEGALAEELGVIDTFRFEEDRILEAALEALKEGRDAAAAEWARARINGGSFWLQNDPSRRSAWQLIEAAATLGLRIDEAGSDLGAIAHLSEAVDRYVALGAPVDQAHRRLAQERLKLLYPQIPRFEALRARLDALRIRWRGWADGWARDFNAACVEHGFLPEPERQQRSLFDEVVRPMTEGAEVTAYFMVDALRFEMAEALYQDLKGTPAATVTLKARLCELPSVTEVGMNVLAPVMSQGRLRPSLLNGKIQGFSTGEYRVSNPKTRKRAIHDRVGGQTCPWLTLAEVLSRDSSALKQTVSKAKLLVVHSMEIDDAGEKGAGPSVFEQVLQKLRAAYHLLREANVRRFVITSDHGFLLLDDASTPPLSHGRKTTPKRRYVFSSVAADHDGEVRVPLARLGYEGVEDAQLMLPQSTAVFDTGKRSMSFVHGGNSLQERVIPVLTLMHRGPKGGDALSYRLKAEAQEDVADMHALSARVLMDAQGTLGFGGRAGVELGLSVKDAPGVSVELCDVRGAELRSGVIHAAVDKRFELFFRLTGSTSARVLVKLSPLDATVKLPPCVLEARFKVTARRVKAPDEAPTPSQGWLEELPAGGVRELFGHLATHGVVTEAEAITMLGSARKLRRFANHFEAHAAKAPFGVRVEVSAGVKRYVREGEDA